jgi:hypothetical protein
MAILPYMKQLPQDYYKKNLPVAPVVVSAPVVAELPYQFPTPELGTTLPPPSGGGIPEAPTDGSTNARQNSAWTSVWNGGSY